MAKTNLWELLVVWVSWALSVGNLNGHTRTAFACPGYWLRVSKRMTQSYSINRNLRMKFITAFSHKFESLLFGYFPHSIMCILTNRRYAIFSANAANLNENCIVMYTWHLGELPCLGIWPFIFLAKILMFKILVQAVNCKKIPLLINMVSLH